MLFGPLPRTSSWGEMVKKIQSAAVPEMTAKKYLWALQKAEYIKKGGTRGMWLTDEKGDAYVDEIILQKSADGGQG